MPGGVRTYLPTLHKVLNFVCDYIARHRDRILQVVGDDNAAAFDALVTACHAVDAIIIVFIPTGR